MSSVRCKISVSKMSMVKPDSFLRTFICKYAHYSGCSVFDIWPNTFSQDLGAFVHKRECIPPRNSLDQTGAVDVLVQRMV